ncbi:MAG: EAL domain-containing protein [Burkholderiaceae bacterium]|nr:EAL domain-containing protein [Burkholderiaceae bacterium]
MASHVNIHQRLLRVLLGSALLAFVAAGVGLAVFQNYTLEQRARQIMEPYAQLVSVGTDAAVAFEDPVRAQEILDTLRVNAQILEADIVLEDGRPLASFRRTPKARAGAFANKPDGFYLSGDRAQLLQKLPNGARLHISMGLDQLGEQTLQFIGIFGAGVAILLAVTFAQLAVLLRTIVRPIAALTETVERVRASADYGHRLPTSGIDEVARLGEGFNAMLGAIQQREDDLRQLTLLQRTILDNVAYGVISASPQGIVTSFNPAAERLLGYTADEVVDKQTPALWHDPQEIARRAAELTAQLGETITPGFAVFTARPLRNLPEDNEWTFIRKDGKRIPVNLSVTALRDEHDRSTGFVGLTYDLTKRKHDEHALHRLNRELRAISDCNQILVRAEDEQSLLDDICRIVCEGADYGMAWVGYAEHDEAKTVRPVAKAGAEIAYLEQTPVRWADGPSGDSPCGAAIRTGAVVVMDDFANASPAQAWSVAALQSGYRSCIALPLKDANARTFGVLGIYSTEAQVFTTQEQRMLEELAGDLAFGIVSLRTRAEREAGEKRIEHLAFYDPLTDLPNRRLLMDRLQQAMSGSARSRHVGALLFIDLDNFKLLNDTCGHDVGDRLLIEVARRLGTCVRDGDTISRLGGDEFVVMLEVLSESASEAAAQAKGVAGKILAALNQPYAIAGRLHHSTPSIGATLFAGTENSVEELLKQADIAMYQAKSAGRNTLRFFDPDMQATLADRADLEAALRLGLQGGQFALHYQAQVHGQRGVVGAEALLRWQHPTRGMVSPAQFIPLAEETGLILPIGQWVLEEACARLAAWSREGHYRDLSLAVNVSARQFRQVDFVDRVRHALKHTGAPATRLKLELTESLVLDNVDDTIAKMHVLKQLGVSFSMDDFGTGYSSLSYLTRLPLDQLKIDQSFVQHLPGNPTDAVVAQAIITLAQSLGLEIIAEGVETEAQRQFLALHGCPTYQGYLFSKPVALADFEALVQGLALETTTRDG